MKTNLLKTIVCLCCLCNYSAVLKSQHPYWRQYTTKDGLPDNEVLDICQDSRAVLWLATQHGICYFNGYEFKQPADTSPTMVGAVLKIEEDQHGRIWFNNLDGALFYVENDTIRHYVFNHLIKPYGRAFRLTYRFAFDETGTLWLGSNDSGFLTVSSTGQLTQLTALPYNTFLVKIIGNQVLAGKKVIGESGAKHSGLPESGFLNITGHPLAKISGGPKISPVPSTIFETWLLKNGDFIFYETRFTGIIRNNVFLKYAPGKRVIKDIAEDKTGNLLAAVVEGPDKGVLKYISLENFHKNKFSNLLPNEEVTALVCDREGGYWAATRGSGIFYCSNPSLYMYDLPLSNHGSISNVATDGRNTIFVGLNPAKVMTIDVRSQTVKSTGFSSDALKPYIDYLRYDPITNSLWAGPFLCFRQDDRWKTPRFIFRGKVISNPGHIKTISQANINGIWWGNSHMGFYSVNPTRHEIQMIPEPPFDRLRTLSVCADYDGRIWVVTQDGLQQWQDGRYIDPPAFIPEIFKKTSRVECLPDSSLLFVLENNGVVIFKRNASFTHLTLADGLLSHKIESVKIAENGRVFIITTAGLNVLTKNEKGAWVVSSVTFKHGLPDSQILDVADLNNELWLAMDEGILHVKNLQPATNVPPPVLASFSVNNQPFTYHSGMVLPAGKNNISVRFYAIHYRSAGAINYRYRIANIDTAFSMTNTREINFTNLAPGYYRLEIQAQNEDGVWGGTAVWPFSIKPHWWATWWFEGALALLMLILVYLYFRRRITRAARLNLEKEQIRELEQKALMAQMNPHFIFNCLQSIQSVVLQKDSATAGNYLARFAKLIRLSLHGSVDGFHSLDDEVALLDSYLYLEQMRFNHSFDYDIKINDIPDPSGIFFPPLLIQPFVENALLHGIYDRTAGGKIVINFRHRGNELHIVVTDNGTNTLSDTSRTHTYKSVGMLLTQQRIALMRTGNALPEMEELRDAAGNKTGTRVRVVIPVEVSVNSVHSLN